MTLMVLSLIAIVVLAVFVARDWRTYHPLYKGYAQTVLVTATVLMGLYTVFWFIFGFGEITSGDPSGLIHVIPGVEVLLLAVLCYRRPWEGGLVLIVLGAVQAILFTIQTGSLAKASAGLVLTGLPHILIGFLLLGAVRLSNQAAQAKEL